MKNFLSIEKFKELKVLFILEILMGLLLAMLISINKIDINYWDWRAFALSIGIWALSSLIDREKYWNLASLIGLCSFMYVLWYFAFNLIQFQ